MKLFKIKDSEDVLSLLLIICVVVTSILFLVFKVEPSLWYVILLNLYILIDTILDNVIKHKQDN